MSTLLHTVIGTSQQGANELGVGDELYRLGSEAENAGVQPGQGKHDESAA